MQGKRCNMPHTNIYMTKSPLGSVCIDSNFLRLRIWPSVKASSHLNFKCHHTACHWHMRYKTLWKMPSLSLSLSLSLSTSRVTQVPNNTEASTDHNLILTLCVCTTVCLLSLSILYCSRICTVTRHWQTLINTWIKIQSNFPPSLLRTSNFTSYCEARTVNQSRKGLKTTHHVHNNWVKWKKCKLK